MAVGDTILIKDISINGNNDLKNASDLSETLKDNTINAFGIDASSRTIWVNGQPYGNAYVNIKEDNTTIEAPIGAEIFNDFENNIASGEYSHAEGFMTEAHGNYSHTEGSYNDARGENSILQGRCLFDYELKNTPYTPFIWLQLYSETTGTITGDASSNNIGCGFIEIKGGPLKIKEQRGDQYFYGTYYQVEGLFYHKGADGVWRQELKLHDYSSGTNYKYYIKSDDFHKIKDTWKQYSQSNPINLTDPFYIYTINTVNYDFPYVTQNGVHVKGCDWCTDPDTTSTRYKEYYERITQIIDTIGLADASDLQTTFLGQIDNSKPELSICNNLTVIGQYNKPKESDIFEVGCGIGGLINGKENAISVDTSGLTTIPKLNSENVTVSNIVTVYGDVTSSETESSELPDKSLVLLSTNTIYDEVNKLQEDTKTNMANKCKSIICSNGILIGYSRQRYMVLSIDENGDIQLAQMTNNGLNKVKFTFK